MQTNTLLINNLDFTKRYLLSVWVKQLTELDYSYTGAGVKLSVTYTLNGSSVTAGTATLREMQDWTQLKLYFQIPEKADHAGDNFARDTVFYLYLDSGYAGMGHVKLLPPVLSLAFVEVLPTGGKAFVEFYPALALPCLPPHRCFRACQDRVGKGV